MFTSPQSKSFLNQESVKNRVLHEEFDLISILKEQLEEVNKQISKLVHTIHNPQRPGKQLSFIRLKMQEMVRLTEQSQKRLLSETFLREKIKESEQKFFKSTMIFYEQKIKELNAYLHRVEEIVQDLEQKGYLPYAQSVQRNNIIPSLKNNVFYYLKKKLDVIQNLHKVFSVRNMKKLVHREDRESLALGMEQFQQKKLTKLRQEIRRKIDYYTEKNKKLKQGIKEQKKQIDYDENGKKMANAYCHNGYSKGREEIIEYWIQMSQNLSLALEKRTHFLMIDKFKKKRSKSETKVRNGEWGEQEQQPMQVCLKEIGNELTNSFMDQCSYLISDRFIVDEQDVNV